MKKKITKKSNEHKKPKSNFLVFLFILLFVLICDFVWIYFVPFYLNLKYPVDVISKSLSSQIGFQVKAKGAEFYTTQSFGLGLKLSNLELSYPRTAMSEKYLFLKSRLADFEIQYIPYLLKTIKFNKFELHITEVELYQDEDGNYVYINRIKSDFKPKMKNYQLEVPSIELKTYTFNNFNARTQEYKVLTGRKKVISPSVSKLVLKEADDKSLVIK